MKYIANKEIPIFQMNNGRQEVTPFKTYVIKKNAEFVVGDDTPCIHQGVKHTAYLFLHGAFKLYVLGEHLKKHATKIK